jgi:hypothetical protein
MKQITAQQLADELELESDLDLFELMVDDFMAKNFIAARANFGILRAASQRQMLKYCNIQGNEDALNFFHSLI